MRCQVVLFLKLCGRNALSRLCQPSRHRSLDSSSISSIADLRLSNFSTESSRYSFIPSFSIHREIWGFGIIRVFPLVAKYCRVWSQGKRTVLIDPDIFLFKSETPLSKQMAVLFKYKAKILCIHILLYCMFDSLNSFSLFLYNR